MKFLLLPFSWIYGIIIAIRNHLFDTNVLKRRSFNIPVISVGNITLCGTGKTPHTEYIVSLLKNSCKVSVLSRGYMRKTKGYVLATEKTEMQEIGDEPFQTHTKFPDVTLAVCENRCDGIQRLMEEEKVEAVVLDDAYQHRYVEPGLNILLVDFHRPISRDHLLPVGMLREPASARKRADVIVVTKCPADMNPLDIRVMTNDLRLLAFQKLFFSTMEYQPLQPLFKTPPLPSPQGRESPPTNSPQGGEPQSAGKVPLEGGLRGISLFDLKKVNVLLVTAIGSPEHIVKDLEPYGPKFKELHYRDHHQFTEKEVYEINETFSFMPSPKILLTTEKDATRLRNLNGFSLDLRRNAYILPIKVKIMLDQEEEFNRIILDYVHKDATAITTPASQKSGLTQGQPLQVDSKSSVPPSVGADLVSARNSDTSTIISFTED